MTSYNCQICGKSHDTLDGLRIHSSRMHDLNAQQVYDKLFPEDGICVDCQAPTKFISLQKGYQQRCWSCAKKWGAEKAALSRRQNYKPAWNAGLTKADNQSLLKISESIKHNIATNGHWNVGKTKENCQHVATAAQKRAKSVKAAYDAGQRHAWHKGLSKDTSASLQKMSQSVREGQLLAVEQGRHWSTSAHRQRVNAIISHAQKHTYEQVKERLMTVSHIWNVDFDTAYEEYQIAKKYINVVCRNCHTRQRRTFGKLLKDDACPICCDGSRWQRQVNEQLKKLKHATIMNDRTVISPKEIDITLPDKRFGIECHGLYWHSDLHEKDPQLSTIKFEMALERGWSLIQLFEDEWSAHNRKVVVSYLNSLFKPFQWCQHTIKDDVLELSRDVHVHCDGHLMETIRQNKAITRVIVDTSRHTISSDIVSHAQAQRQFWWTDFSKRCQARDKNQQHKIFGPPRFVITIS